MNAILSFFNSALVLLSLVVPVVSDQLDDVLTTSSGIFPSDSVKCAGKSSTSFSSVFRSTNHISAWSDVNVEYESDAFEIDMTHDDVLPERSWTLRLGKGGQIMSLIVQPGESIANQALPNAIWIDLVQQMVAVNENLNGVGGKANFIHGAGVYANETEGTKPPFYSPKLALKCDGNDCTIINWGQQAHIPTPWDSPLLFYTRYRDCGDGIIQYDMAMYHFGQNASTFGFFNTPWTGVRTSTFPDFLTSDKDGNLKLSFPLNSFGNEQILNLDQTGGFSTFAENVDIPVDYFLPFCVEKSNPKSWHNCNNENIPNNSWRRFAFDVKVANSASHTDHWKAYGLAEKSTVRMRWCDLATPIRDGAWGWGAPGQSVTITNEDTGFSFESDFIIHYCWVGVWTYMSASVDATVINNRFPVGASISVEYTNKNGDTWNEQNALTFVHGQGNEYGEGWHRAKSRIRYGTTNLARDGTVFTTNFIGNLRNGEVYFSRKFLISDTLSHMEKLGAELSDEAYEEVYQAGSYGGGEIINLWTRGVMFGATVGYEECTNSTLVCTGTSSPATERRPLFYITCGANRIVTHNPYTDPYYGNVTDSEFKRPYKCYLNASDYARSGRGTWKLLGFFPNGNCSSIGNLEYASDLCQPAPSSIPTEIKTMLPSLTPNPMPSPISSPTPSKCETEKPSLKASSSQNEVQTPLPSSLLSQSSSPSNLQSAVQSSKPSSAVANFPTCSNTHIPTEFSPSIDSSAQSVSNPPNFLSKLAFTWYGTLVFAGGFV
mmetsp:Transcript_28193/g.42652  ORF Transcript_28193/g.42652 Transcript_28193/m.42652 type:complete len:773 (-) Transcript_28193:212-2530(-)